MKQFVTEGRIYKPSEIQEVLSQAVDEDMLVSTGKRTQETKLMIRCYNLPAAFDIETTSLYLDGEIKSAPMYVWQFGINGYVVIGRTWDEFENMLAAIIKTLDLAEDKRLVIYVHNLSFEFQYIRKHFEWEKVFASDSRKVIYAITKGRYAGFEFRCSYFLSGYALAKLSDELQKYKVAKMVGDLDYSLLRHSGTPLTDQELKYCENDVRVVMAYIQERIEIDGNITTDKIPLTKTGYVRKYCRNACLFEGTNHRQNVGKFISYRKKMASMTLEVDEYRQLKRAFQGGFTHANAFYSQTLLENVASYDFTSSYPYVMVSEMFPMEKGYLVNGNGQLHSKDEFEKYLLHYCCLFDVVFYGLMTQVTYEHPLSYSRCVEVKNCVADNGRVVCADKIATTITEQDYFIFRKAYTWDRIEIANFRVYRKGYLPTNFVKSILKLYSDKTTLKGVKGKEVEYQMGKGMLNSAYGMCVTDICRDEIIYNDEHVWRTEPGNHEELLKQYNESKKRFLFYPWGVWVTAYARRNLFTGIYEFQDDYVYSDTDSVKVLNHEKHRDYIESYNAMCRKKLEAACQYHGIDFSAVEPSTIKGEKKLLGVWDFEGVYDKFKTLGAKRYLVEKDGHIEITVSGVHKKMAAKYLLDTYGMDGAFDAFDDNLTIPADDTGKNTHTYVDDVTQGIFTDYLGNEGEFIEQSCVHLEKAEYSLSMSVAYLNYLKGVRTIER